MKKIVVLISGKGSNLKAIIKSSIIGVIKGRIVAVFSNYKLAYGLKYAYQANIPYHILEQSHFNDRESFEKKLVFKIDQYEPDLIVLAGYMSILSSFFVNKYYRRIINIHPSLLPKYPGLNTHQKVLSNGDTEHGSTIHFVDNKIDHGPIILQVKIPILRNDNELEIIKRLKKKEHIVYPLVISWFVDERIKFFQEKIWVDKKLSPIIVY